MAGVVFSKASGVNDSIFGKSQEPIKAIIEERLEAYQQGSVLDKVFVMEKSNNFAEKYVQETSLANFSPVGEGGAYPENSFQEGYSSVIEPDTWKNQFEVTQEMIEDAKMGKIKQRANQFTRAYNRSRESFGAAMLMGGVGTSVTFGGKKFATTCADGKALFSTTHPSKTKGTKDQSNLFAEDFSYDMLCKVQEKMQNMRDDDGHLLGVSPDTIIIPNDGMLKKAVFNAIGAEGDPSSSNPSTFNFQYGLWNVIIWPYLNEFIPSTATSKPWFLMDSRYNQDYYGAVFLDRVGLTVRSEIAPNDNNVFKGRARYSAGFVDFRAFACSFTGSGGTDL